MAYQHLFGSTSGGSSGAGYKTLAATPEFYNVMSDDELSNYNNYSFAAGDEHPVKFCHYYKEYKQRFIQSAVSFEYDYVGRNSSIAHTLVLSEEESNYILKEHTCPFSPVMFMNSRNDNFERPRSETLPEVDYRFLECGDREYNTNAITKYFRSDVFAQFILAIIMSAGNGYSVFVKLPGTAREASYNAIRLMNIIIPAFPAEYKKKLGFMTYVTDTYAYEDVSIYFVSGVDLEHQFINSAYCFDLSKDRPFISGLDTSSVKEYSELLRTVMSNILAYDNSTLNDYYNDILPKIDSYDRFSLEKINEIFFMWKFLSGTAEDELDSESACAILSSFYNFCDIVDNKAKFLNRINGFWEKEIEKCKEGGYAPSIEIFGIVSSHYSDFGEDEKRQAQRIWAFALIYTLLNNDTTLFDSIYSYEYDGSKLAEDIFRYTVYIYVGAVHRRDKNEKMKAVYSKIVGGYIERCSESDNRTRLLEALGHTIHITDHYYSEMSIDRKGEYDLFAECFYGFFKERLTSRFNDAGLMRRFDAAAELKKYTYYCDAGEHGTGSELGIGVYEYFHSSVFIPSVIAGLTDSSIEKMADDRKLLDDVSHKIEEYPELSNIGMISLFQHFCGIIGGRKDISIVFELSELVNKPDMQHTLTEWVSIYTRKYPDLILSILANSSCQIGPGAGMEYSIDFTAAYKAYYENIGRDSEQMLRDLNRFIGDIEADMNRAEFRELGLASFKEPTVNFINSYFFDKTVDRKKVKEHEAMLKRFDKVRAIRTSADGKEKKHKLFGKK